MAIKIDNELFTSIGQQLAGTEASTKPLFDNLYKQGVYTMQQDKKAMDALEAENPSGIDLGVMPKGLQDVAQSAVSDLAKEYKQLAWEATYRPKKKDAAVQRMNAIKSEMSAMKTALNKALVAEKNTIDGTNNFGILSSSEIAMRNARSKSDYPSVTWNGSDFVTNLGDKEFSVASTSLTSGKDVSGRTSVLKATMDIGKLNNAQFETMGGQIVDTTVANMSNQAKLDIAYNGIDGAGLSLFKATVDEIKKTSEYTLAVNGLMGEGVREEEAVKVQDGIEMQNLINKGISDDELKTYILESAGTYRTNNRAEEARVVNAKAATSKENTDDNQLIGGSVGIWDIASNKRKHLGYVNNNKKDVVILENIQAKMISGEGFKDPFNNQYLPSKDKGGKVIGYTVVKSDGSKHMAITQGKVSNTPLIVPINKVKSYFAYKSSQVTNSMLQTTVEKNGKKYRKVDGGYIEIK